MKLKPTLLSLALAVACGLAQAVTLRVSNQGDVQSMDPHSLNESLQLSFTGNVYESLIERDKNMALTPLLATKWTQQSPTVWRFELRQGVTFHDGSAFTADDVVFTLQARGRRRLRHEGLHQPDQGGAQGQRLRGRHRDHVAVPDPARHADHARHDEQEVVRGEQGRAAGRPPQGHREHGQLQGQRHRPVPPEGAPALGAHGARAQLQLPQQDREQRRRDRLHADRQRRHPRGRAACRARPT